MQHPDPGETARRVYFDRLARVVVRHGYYRATGGACADFAITPTAHSALLMRRLGLLFREEPDGFSVLYNRLRQQQLLDFLDRDRQLHTNEAWTRLCFVLSLRNPSFVNFTAVPIDTNPARENFYLTNRQAHAEADGRVLLPPGHRVTRAERVPVTGGQFVETVGDGVDSVQVLDVSGELLVCKPRCVRRDDAPVPVPPVPSARAAAVAAVADPLDACRGEEPGPGVVCQDRLFFNLAGLPEEKYYLRTTWRGSPPPAATYGEYLYTASAPNPLAFVEILFSDPHAAAPPAAGAGVYPVRGLGGPDPRIETVEYVVPFAARRTWWSYFVVAEPQAAGDGELRIRQVRKADEPRVAFRGPCLVRMAGGRTARRFVSNRRLALEERSPLHLQLVRVRDRGGRVDVVMDRLPVAQGRQVLPLSAGQACDQARETLCPRGHRCRKLLDWLCPGDSPPVASHRNFSDIYVYV